MITAKIIDNRLEIYDGKKSEDDIKYFKSLGYLPIIFEKEITINEVKRTISTAEKASLEKGKLTTIFGYRARIDNCIEKVC